jgi:hypothetical protein
MPYANAEQRREYHRNYMRDYNKTHSLTAEQKKHKLEYMKEFATKNADKIAVYDKSYRANPKVRLNRYVYSAKKRGIDFNLTSEDFNTLLLLDCHYCGEPKANGVDRKNNGRGYYSDNVVACCKTCNYMKGRLDYQEFFDHMRKIMKKPH